MSHPRKIRKYRNRRLYDTEISRYVTLKDIRELVLKHIDFTITDQSGHDITRRILVMVLMADSRSAEVLSREHLLRLIRHA